MNNKILNNISYETFNKCTKASEIILLSMPLTNILLHSPALAYGICGIDALLLIALLNKYKLLEETKEIKEINKLYKEFIKEYSKLNKIFNLNNPVEIYNMYNYLLYSGYLSKNKKFKYGTENVFDEVNSIMGANIMTGNSVCRHIAPALRDIYLEENIESIVLPVKTTKNILENENESNDISEEMIEELLCLCQTGLKLEETLNILADKKLKELNNKPKIKPNHVITMAIQNDKKYLLDPTQDFTALYTDCKNKENYIINNEGTITIIDQNKKRIISHNNNINKNYDIKSKLELPCTSIQDNLELIEENKKIYQKNLYIFEDFYRENHEIYDEVTALINKLNQNNKTKKLTLK